MRVIAYTYEADYHCLACTAKGFNPPDSYGDYHGVDSEGNEIHPVFDTDEWYANDIYEGVRFAKLVCGDCLEIIEEVDLNP